MCATYEIISGGKLATDGLIIVPYCVTVIKIEGDSRQGATKMTTDNHAKDQAAAQLAHIRSPVAALECDYDRLEELREASDDESAPIVYGTGSPLDSEELEELTALEAQANGCENRDAAYDNIQEHPLSVEVRSGWHNPGEESEPEEFQILLCTGGPAVRIMGELNEHGEPDRAWLEYQDWGTPWTHYYEEGAGDVLLTYCQQFYFGG